MSGKGILAACDALEYACFTDEVRTALVALFFFFLFLSDGWGVV